MVGSGNAGLAATIAAAEKGARTLMLEKNPSLRGKTGWSVGSIITSASRHQRAIDIYDTPNDYYAGMELFHGERPKGRDNVKQRRLLGDRTPATFDWLLSLSLIFYGPMPKPPHTQPRMHSILPNAQMLIHHLTQCARKLGVMRPRSALTAPV